VLGWAIVVSVVVATLLAVLAVQEPGPPLPNYAPTPPARPTANPAAVLPRPGVNGSTRPPLSPAAQRAVERLAVTSRSREGGDAHGDDGGHLFGPVDESALDPSDEERFSGQWARAVRGTGALDTTEKATAAGYVPSSTPAPGVGVHWVNWELISRPFDPARPSMLLFATVRGVDRLVGFSYWVQSGRVPEGFAGPNDVWHTHSGLCVVNGWVEREAVTDAAECPGSWLAGGDLWMLHAWTVADFPNRWGRFAPTNPTLCPTGRVPDLASCRPDNG
jgi:hypothetical protein